MHWEHIYSLYSVINKRKLGRQSTFACFVDAKKAFDTIYRDCLWYNSFNSVMIACDLVAHPDSCWALQTLCLLCNNIVKCSKCQ